MVKKAKARKRAAKRNSEGLSYEVWQSMAVLHQHCEDEVGEGAHRAISDALATIRAARAEERRANIETVENMLFAGDELWVRAFGYWRRARVVEVKQGRKRRTATVQYRTTTGQPKFTKIDAETQNVYPFWCVNRAMCSQIDPDAPAIETAP